MIWCRPRTTVPDRSHRKYPYLLRDLKIDRANQVWCTDFMYVPMPVGHAYLCAVMDWHTRKVLGWAVSNTMDTELCLNALGAWWNLVVEVTVLQPCELVTEVQFTAKEEDSDPVIRRIAEPSGSSFQGLDFTIEPLTDRIGNPV